MENPIKMDDLGGGGVNFPPLFLVGNTHVEQWKITVGRIRSHPEEREAPKLCDDRGHPWFP